VDALLRALHARLPDPRRVDDYYGPLGAWCAARVAARGPRPWVLGLQGPQGGGKSTLAAALVAGLGDIGVRGVAVSIDDFYLTHQEQTALAARHPGNPYLLYRGYPGTHDVALGERVIDALVALGSGETALVPTYDKSAHAGRGDRAPEAAWRRVEGPLDLLIVEGWMLGFSPVDAAPLAPDLQAPNALLGAYGSWSQRLDAFVSLQVDSLDAIVRWRIDAERARRDRGEAALSDEDARDYIERFLPAYRLYAPALAARPPCRDARVIALGDDRMPRP
jgi:D-glycerate 3-kinase